MSTKSHRARLFGIVGTLALLVHTMAWGQSQSKPGYQVFVSNEKSGNVTVIDGDTFKVVATIPAGKRPRGIHVSPDGKTVYVALSGTPIEGPPELDAQGNPILKKSDDDADADKSADGIGVLSVGQRKLMRKISVGSDPEEFSLSPDGTHLYVSNEDVKTASVVNIATGKVEHIIPVSQEPEGVNVTPDGKSLYITCETGGDIFVVDTVSYKTIANFRVHPRPRSVDFSLATGHGFIPSESSGELNVIDFAEHKLLQTIALPAGSRPMRVKISRDGKEVYVSNGRAGTVAIVDGTSYQVLASIRVGQRPWGIALSPDGKYLFSANGPSNDVSVIDLTTRREIAKIKAGASPWGIAVASVTR